MWGLGAQNCPHIVKNLHVAFDSPKTCLPSVSTGDWLQDPLQIAKSEDAQVPYVKWCRTKHIVSPLYPRGFPNTDTKHYRYLFFLKTHIYVDPLTRVVQSYVVQVSTVYVSTAEITKTHKIDA